MRAIIREEVTILSGVTGVWRKLETKREIM